MTGHFEAKLTAKRETAAGIYLTVQVQPADYGAELATLRVGSVLMLAWSEIVNVEVEPIELARTDGKSSQSPISMAKPNADRAEPHKERRPFNTLPLPQQAAIRCQDNDFKLFLDASNAEDAARILRERCGVSSRSELIAGTPAGDAWLAIEAQYQMWRTDRRYGDAA
jgi:hypothetical protein